MTCLGQPAVGEEKHNTNQVKFIFGGWYRHLNRPETAGQRDVLFRQDYSAHWCLGKMNNPALRYNPPHGGHFIGSMNEIFSP